MDPKESNEVSKEDSKIEVKETNDRCDDQRKESPVDEPVEKQIELSEEEQKMRMERSIDLKNKGNVHFVNEEYEQAIELYDRSLEELKECASVDKKRSIILNNKAVCRWRLLEKSKNVKLDFKDENVKTEFDEIVNLLNKSIELDPAYFKPYLKRAELNHKFGADKLENSLEDYKKLLELVPDNKRQLLNDVKHEICKIEQEIEQRNEQLKQEMFSKLKDLGNLCLKPFGLSTENFKLQQNESGGYSINFQQQQ